MMDQSLYHSSVKNRPMVVNHLIQVLDLTCGIQCHIMEDALRRMMVIAKTGDHYSIITEVTTANIHTDGLIEQCLHVMETISTFNDMESIHYCLAIIHHYRHQIHIQSNILAASIDMINTKSMFTRILDRRDMVWILNIINGKLTLTYQVGIHLLQSLKRYYDLKNVHQLTY